MDKNHSNLINRHNLVGGQAVIEGVMMKKDNRVSLAVRKEDGTIEIKNTEFNTVRKKVGLFNKPIIRGIIAFVESLVLSFKTLGNSTAMLDLDDNKDKNGKKKSGAMNIIIMVISLVLGLGISLVLFSVLPTLVGREIVEFFKLDDRKTLHYIILALIEGFLKIAIFIAYLFVVSLMKDIRRTFEYHGAEHKTIACFESGHELTIENVRKCTRLHPRCGTSFMFVTILLSVLVSAFVSIDAFFPRVLVKLILLPLVVGISYEYIMYAGKNENIITKILSAPGLWMQRITTKEPSDDQIAVAICAVKAAVPELYRVVGEEEFAITKVENRHHIANMDKNYPAEEPIYKVPESKLELFQRNAESESSDVEITVNGKPSKINVTKYTKQ